MANFSDNKRALFRRLANKECNVLRPPWAIEEYDFVDSCTSCEACFNACTQKVIQLDSRKQPYIDFDKSECTFCGDCVNACESGALNFSKSPPWNAIASINHHCLAEQQTYCRSCGEVCETEAISFRPFSRAISKPEIKTDNCNGCGACVSICPVQAIQVSYQSETVTS